MLPPTHAVLALNKIFTYGAGFADILYEISMLLILTVIYYAIGVILFRKKHILTA